MKHLLHNPLLRFLMGVLVMVWMCLEPPPQITFAASNASPSWIREIVDGGEMSGV